MSMMPSALRSHTGSSGNTFTYTGEQVDPEAGLVFLRARYYDPEIGRFISRDWFAGFERRTTSINRYSYAENNPIKYIDPRGEYALWDDAAAIALGATKGAISD